MIACPTCKRHVPQSLWQRLTRSRYSPEAVLEEITETLDRHKAELLVGPGTLLTVMCPQGRKTEVMLPAATEHMKRWRDV